MRRLGLALVLLLGLGGGRPAVAATPSDAWLEGYAAAVLERDFRLTAPSLRERDGVISLSAEDLADADRERVLQVLGAVRGALRVLGLGAHFHF